jgi:hypothetical protein
MYYMYIIYVLIYTNSILYIYMYQPPHPLTNPIHILSLTPSTSSHKPHPLSSILYPLSSIHPQVAAYFVNLLPSGATNPTDPWVVFSGRVTKYGPATEDEEALYHVLWEDGDEQVCLHMCMYIVYVCINIVYLFINIVYVLTPSYIPVYINPLLYT